MAEMEITANRTYKARIFEMVFNNKKELLALYNAINKTGYTDPEQLEINTLDNAIYMSMKNDISFIIDSRLSLYEHQSTHSPNLPLRCLFYVSDLYSNMTRDTNLYGAKPVKIPTPRFIVFYNGRDDCPERQELKLSAAYSIEDREPSLELRATVLNINPGYNKELLEACRTLSDYSAYTNRVRNYTETMRLEDAVEKAIAECIREGILSEFLSRNRAEAKKMSIYEYDEEKHMRQTREEGYEDGEAAGVERGIKALVQTCQDLNLSKENTVVRLQKQFSLSETEAQSQLDKYWDCNSKEPCISPNYEKEREKLIRQTREEGYEDGEAAGRVAAMELGIKALIQTCQALNASKTDTLTHLKAQFSLPDEQAEEKLEKYWISQNN